MKLFVAIFGCLLCLNTFSQKVILAKTDSLKTPTAAPANYDKIIPKNALTREGLFTVKSVDNKWYFEVPDSLMGRYILVVTRYIATPEGFGSYGGEEVNKQTVYFEKSRDNKLLLRAVVYNQDAPDSSQSIFKAVQASNVNPIVGVFEIKAINPVSKHLVIDVTDFFRKDNAVVSIGAREKTDRKLNSLMDDRSFITDIKSFPINVEVKTLKTFSTSSQAYAAASIAGSVTLETNTSMVILPEKPMRKRLYDERVGFFANRYMLFDENAHKSEKVYYVQRYRLEPKPEDVDKYSRGELVEPAKPIVYYIDPATPKKWRPYLMAGVNDWQKAFEQAGFKNAILAKEWPEDDTSMSLEDARFSVIRYHASSIPNAYGPRISDPRSGEIIESHVGWFHDVMKLVHDWYFVQAGALDPGARTMRFNDSLMGDLIRFVSSHEIGHTLGLAHNMGASSQTPVEKLRDKKWLAANGHTVSIMDYARFNYVAQPEDSVGKEGLYPRIGCYDKWAIQWGYKNFVGAKDEQEEKALLNKMVLDSLSANPRLWFGGEGKNEDPRSQREDLGNDAVKAGDYGIKNLKRIVKELPEWTKTEGDLYKNLEEMHRAVVLQYKRYIGHVSKSFGNRYITEKSVEQKGLVYQNIPKDVLKQSIGFVNRHVLNPPLWLYPEYTRSFLGLRPAGELIDQQNGSMLVLLSAGLLFSIEQTALTDPSAYKVPEYLEDLGSLVWGKMPVNHVEAFYRRALQRQYLERVIQLIYLKELSEGKQLTTFQRTDIRIYAMEHMRKINNRISNQLQQPLNATNRQHLKDIQLEIEKVFAKVLNKK